MERNTKEYWQQVSHAAFDRVIEQKKMIESKDQIICNLNETIEEQANTIKFLHGVVGQQPRK